MMIKTKEKIEKIIHLRASKFDILLDFAVRNKASPAENWCSFIYFDAHDFDNIYLLNIDGVKLRFRYTTLEICCRHNLK